MRLTELTNDGEAAYVFDECCGLLNNVFHIDFRSKQAHILGYFNENSRTISSAKTVTLSEAKNTQNEISRL